MSHFAFTRSVWRKSALDLLVEPNFFQMDSTALKYWLTVVDNLMTHDKATFRDLMSEPLVA